jgi:hypothetical protein
VGSSGSAGALVVDTYQYRVVLGYRGATATPGWGPHVTRSHLIPCGCGCGCVSRDCACVRACRIKLWFLWTAGAAACTAAAVNSNSNSKRPLVKIPVCLLKNSKRPRQLMAVKIRQVSCATSKIKKTEFVRKARKLNFFFSFSESRKLNIYSLRPFLSYVLTQLTETKAVAHAAASH